MEKLEIAFPAIFPPFDLKEAAPGQSRSDVRKDTDTVGTIQ